MNSLPAKRTLTAIVFADVVGYSRLMGEDEAGTLRRLTEYRSEVIDPTVQRFRGHIVNSAGDSLLLDFDSIVEAALCAIALQKAVAERNHSLDANRRLVFRIGVNIGDVIVQDRNLFGDGVNVAARLQTLCEPGGLCLSSSAHEQVAGKIDAPFTDMGSHRVKNIARDVFAYGLSAEAIAALELPTRPPPGTPRRSLVFTGVVGGVILFLAAGGVAFLKRGSGPDFAARMDSLLSATQSKLNDRARAKIIADYIAIGPHKAFAIARKAQSHWWTGDWPSAEIAAQKVIERCQLAFGEPCELAALDGEIEPPRGQASDANELAFAGDFDPAKIPGVRQSTTARSDVAGYLGAAAPKAAAIHPRGLIAIVTGASTQRRAESQALKRCNDDDAAKDGDGPCYLYAVGDKVVLSQRRTTPITPP